MVFGLDEWRSYAKPEFQRETVEKLAAYEQIALNQFPVLGFIVQFNGSLTILYSYNVVAVTRTAVGTYRIEIDQDTIYGVPVETGLPVTNVSAPDAAGETVSSRHLPGAPAGFMDVYTYTMEISGQNLFDDGYDLGPNDTCFAGGILHVPGTGVPPLPPP